MRREFYPLEMRTTKRREFLVYGQKFTWRIYLTIAMLIIAVSINIVLIASIITIITGSSLSPYYEISYWDTGFDSILSRFTPSIGTRLPVFAFTYDFKLVFHIYFWVMTLLYLVFGTGIIQKTYEGVELNRKIFHGINLTNLLIGLFRVIILFTFMEYNSLIFCIVLTIYLTFIPMLIVLPFQILLRNREQSLIEWLKEEKRSFGRITLKSTILVSSITIISIGLIFSYFGVEILV